MSENSSDYGELEAAGEYLEARWSELRDIALDLQAAYDRVPRMPLRNPYAGCLSEAGKCVREAQLWLSEALGHLPGQK